MWVSRKADHKKVPKFQKGHYYTPGVWTNRKSVTSCNPPELVGIESTESLTNLDSHRWGRNDTSVSHSFFWAEQKSHSFAIDEHPRLLLPFSTHFSLSNSTVIPERKRQLCAHRRVWFLCSAWVSPTPLQGFRDIWITPWLLLVSGDRWVSREKTTVWKDMQPSTRHFY